MALVLECRQTPYRATLLLLGSELEQPFVLLGMKDTLEPKIRKALPENILRSNSLRYLWLLKRSGKQKQPASSKLLSLPLFSSIDLSSSLLSFLPKLPSSHFSPSPNQWGAASIHQTCRHLPCIPCKSSHPHLLIKEASAATNQVRRSDYLDQDVCVHTDSALMRSLSGYLLFGHSATDPFNSGTLPSTDSGTGWHFLPECHYYSPLVISHNLV